MTKAVKAALLSALIFPGAGHFFLKKPLLGCILSGASLAALAVIISKVVETALQITEKIQSGEVQLDIAAMADLISPPVAAAEGFLLKTATWVLLICWLGGMIDAYLAGRQQDQAGAANR